jgi:hypothetical protein
MADVRLTLETFRHYVGRLAPRPPSEAPPGPPSEALPRPPSEAPPHPEPPTG